MIDVAWTLQNDKRDRMSNWIGSLAEKQINRKDPMDLAIQSPCWPNDPVFNIDDDIRSTLDVIGELIDDPRGVHELFDHFYLNETQDHDDYWMIPEL